MSKFRVGEIVTVKHDLKSGQPFGDKFKRSKHESAVK